MASLSMLEAALAYASRGWAVFPLAPGGKLPAIASAHPQGDAQRGVCRGECGRLGHGVYDASTDPTKVRAMFDGRTDANTGLAAGAVSGFDVLDVDAQHDGLETLARLEAAHGALPATAQQLTPHGGTHYLFRHVPGLKNRAGLDGAPGLDVRTTGGYVAAWPSRLSSEARGYLWEAAHDPADAATPIAEWPAWLLAMVPRRDQPRPDQPLTAGGQHQHRPTQGRPGSDAESRARAWLAKADPAVSGQGGHAATFRVACALVQGFGLAPKTALELLIADFNPRCQPPWSEGELAHKCEDAAKAAPQAGKPQGWLLDAPRPERNGHARGQTPAAAVGLTEGAPMLEGDAAEVPLEVLGEDGGPVLEEPTHDGGADSGHETGDGGSSENLSDLGNARRLVRGHGHLLRFVKAAGWLAWDGRRWRMDDTGGAERLAKRVPGMLWRELETARRAGDAELAKRIAAWALKSESAHCTAAMLEQARSERGLVARLSDFDRNPWLLNVTNGTLDLRTLTLRPHRREDLLTRLAPVAWDPTAEAPTWRAFLERVLPDPEVRGYVQRSSGYGLTGDTTEQVFDFWYGMGANGKSTAIETRRAAMGDYACSTPFDTFLVRQGDGPRNDIAALKGARFVTASEPPSGARLDEGVMKQLTGEDEVTARFLHKEFFSYSPQFKVVLVANNKPRIRGTDDGMWRRVRLRAMPKRSQRTAKRARLRRAIHGSASAAQARREDASRLLRPLTLAKIRRNLAACRKLRIGDWIQVVRVPSGINSPGYIFDRDTRALYRELIEDGRAQQIWEKDDWGVPWIAIRWRGRPGHRRHVNEFLAMNDDSWVRARPLPRRRPRRGVTRHRTTGPL